MLIPIDHHRRAPALRHLHGDDLLGEEPLLPGPTRLLLARRREGILVRARYLEISGHVLRRHPHMAVAEDAPQPVLDHAVNQRAVPHAVPEARLGQHERRPAHALHTARHHNLRLAQRHRLSRQRHRLQARPAHLVHRRRGHAHRDLGLTRRLARRVHPQARREHVAHEHLVDLLPLDVRPPRRLRNGNRTQLHRRHLRQTAPEGPHRRSRRRHDHCFFHVCLRFATLSRNRRASQAVK